MCLKCRLFSNEVRMCNCECTYFFYIKNRAGCEPYSTDYVLPTISLCLFFHLALVFVDFVDLVALSLSYIFYFAIFPRDF